ncbi:MAG: hypothetical protein JWN15_2021 [Firmicutes bacterium]|nr:hypothetical protein [Bacillota bacterium]
MSPTATVPASILLSPDLSPSAKWVWISLQLETGQQLPNQLSPQLVTSTCRLTRTTIRRALAELKDANLLPASTALGSAAPERTARLPRALLTDTRLGAWEILLYGIFQLTQPCPHFTFAELQALVGTGPKPLRRAAQLLQATGWLHVTRGKRGTPIRFTLRNPAADRCAAMIAVIDQRVSRPGAQGEAVMKAYLSLLISSDEYTDNARPGFMTNPDSGEPLEFDRYYTAGVALEFNGPQHDGPTEKYPSTAEARKQRTRDLIKHGLCAEQGIKLIIIHAEELTLKTMQERISDLLPLRNLEDYQPVIAHLEQLSEPIRQQGAKLAAKLVARAKRTCQLGGGGCRRGTGRN